MKKYRFDKECEQQPNGSIPVITEVEVWVGQPTLAGVKNCPVDFPGVTARTAYITGEPNTQWSCPARIRFRGNRVNGYVRYDGEARNECGEWVTADGGEPGFEFFPLREEEHKLR